MRRSKKEKKYMPFLTGVIVGYVVTLVMCVAAALLMLMTDSAEGMSGTASVIATAAASFFAGRSAGKLRRRSGLKTGALCGIIYIIPLLLLSLLFGSFGGVLFFIKLFMCIAFGAAGGVLGVNSVP